MEFKNFIKPQMFKVTKAVVKLVSLKMYICSL